MNKLLAASPSVLGQPRKDSHSGRSTGRPRAKRRLVRSPESDDESPLSWSYRDGMDSRIETESGQMDIEPVDLRDSCDLPGNMDNSEVSGDDDGQPEESQEDSVPRDSKVVLSIPETPQPRTEKTVLSVPETPATQEPRVVEMPKPLPTLRRGRSRDHDSQNSSDSQDTFGLLLPKLPSFPQTKSPPQKPKKAPNKARARQSPKPKRTAAKGKSATKAKAKTAASIQPSPKATPKPSAAKRKRAAATSPVAQGLRARRKIKQWSSPTTRKAPTSPRKKRGLDDTTLHVRFGPMHPFITAGQVKENLAKSGTTGWINMSRSSSGYIASASHAHE